MPSSKCSPEPRITGDVTVQALPSGPGYPRENNQRLIVSLIHAAASRVVITMPYLVPDEALLQALQTAVLRGIDVTLVVPLQMDQILVHLAQRLPLAPAMSHEEQVGKALHCHERIG